MRRLLISPHGSVLRLFIALLMSVPFQQPLFSAETDEEFFETKIRPLLIDRCIKCHADETGKTHGGLALDTRAGWERGGESGTAVVPGNAADSLLIVAVQYGEGGPQMPPEEAGGKLSAAEIGLLSEWVNRGAFDPRLAKSRIAGMDEAEAKTWWAFQPVPEPADQSDLQLDLLIDQQIAAVGLSKAPVADRRTLLRRASFDLTGLPPTPEEMSSFLNDTQPDAFARAVDRLLASPQYGERWGRHWLDLARYTDSWDARGYGGAGDIAEAWRYRDWVVSAMNRDIPYDQFIREQLAGDVINSLEGSFDPARVTATGVYAIGDWGNGDADKQKIHTDIVDDQIDFTSRGFLGITLACARCHDHKFDPLTTRDYHAMAGFFYSSRILENFTPPGAGEEPMRIDLTTPEERQQQVTRQQRLAEIDTILNAMLRPLINEESNALGTAGLFRLTKPGSDTPSLNINETDADLQVLTFNVPRRGIAVHPGPTSPVSAVWVSPSAATVNVRIQLSDSDPNCGDGIAWELRLREELIGSGSIANGGTEAFTGNGIEIKQGELLRLIIRPQAGHACDTTVVDFQIMTSKSPEAERGHMWSLRESLSEGKRQGTDGWWVCEGDGQELIGNESATQALEAERAALVSGTAVGVKVLGLAEGGIRNTSYNGFHDARIHKRGRYDQLGDAVPRGVPALLAKAPLNVSSGSGRLELANWIASPENPLTARVMVNRIWQQHFGHGLVRTPNNFGKLGQSPSHPELLDWLAWKFVQNSWSIKQLHRLIMNSAAYQRSSEGVVEGAVKDPTNLLLAHQNRRRLSAEELRDSLLVAAGTLDLTMGGPAVREISVPRRTLYIATIRSDRSGFRAMFDGANSQAIVDLRTDSVVAPQALWLMNNDFALAQVNALAVLVANQPGDVSQQLSWLIDRLFQRQPTPLEVSLAERVITDPGTAASWEPLCHVFLCTNEYIYVD
ncbi:MAG: PSD1 domain-containing protein [Planctomyces sp.]|nr:PSD1 domain-containing protein [Planctomyces sp.]